MLGFFRKKKRTLLDELNDATVKMYRPLLVNNKKVSDEKILEVVQTTMRAFTQAAESKGEKISGNAEAIHRSYPIPVQRSQVI